MSFQINHQHGKARPIQAKPAQAWPDRAWLIGIIVS